MQSRVARRAARRDCTATEKLVFESTADRATPEWSAAPSFALFPPNAASLAVLPNWAQTLDNNSSYRKKGNIESSKNGEEIMFPVPYFAIWYQFCRKIWNLKPAKMTAMSILGRN